MDRMVCWLVSESSSGCCMSRWETGSSRDELVAQSVASLKLRPYGQCNIHTCFRPVFCYAHSWHLDLGVPLDGSVPLALRSVISLSLS